VIENNAPAIYLFPSTLSDAPLANILPPYNIELIRGVKHFVVENIRTARRFLKLCDRSINIDELTFYELNNHTDPATIPSMLAPIEQGFSIGVISEAGCPAVADPGAQVVAIAQQRGYRVVPLIGPSSILLALMGSGFNGQSFAFTGYLPIEPQKRTAALHRLHREIVNDRRTQIFIETPYRNNKLIKEIVATLPGNTLLCVASDITGANQRITTLPLSKWKQRELDYDKTPAIFLLYN
jgi:16S rRNA (cytidine1402-2'-O)-methyltransferase